jgi:hypothetical protein
MPQPSGIGRGNSPYALGYKRCTSCNQTNEHGDKVNVWYPPPNDDLTYCPKCNKRLRTHPNNAEGRLRVWESVIGVNDE